MHVQALKKYLKNREAPLSRYLLQIQQKTQDEFEGSHMLCGAQVASLLSILVKLVNAKYVVDIGTYVGFSALVLAEAIGKDGTIVTCERDQRYFEVAKENISSHPDGHKVQLFQGEAKDCIDQLDKPLDLSFLDADKAPYIDYYARLVEKTRPGGIIVIDDALWKGMVAEPNTPRLHLMDQFNDFVQNDSRVENLLIPIRHGVNLIYKL